MVNGTIYDLSYYLAVDYWVSNGTFPRVWNLDRVGANATGGNITYSVRANWFDVDGIASNHALLVHKVFKYLQSVSGIAFTEALPGENAHIAFGNQESGAYTFINEASLDRSSGQYFLGSVGINIESDWYSASPSDNDYVFQTILHEVGHALGLGHQSDYNGSATYPTDADFLNDSWSNSIMSYFSQTENTQDPADYAFLQTLMVSDLYALDYLYARQSSADQSYGSQAAFQGDTIYGFNTNIKSSEDPVFANLSIYATENAYCIVDSGGIDTFDFSG